MAKSSRDVYLQRGRLYQLAMDRAERRAAQAHPATGGNRMLCHNWGNDASNAAWSDADRLWRRIDAASNAAYDLALHREHAESMRLVRDTVKPTWCKHCRESEMYKITTYTRSGRTKVRKYATIDAAKAVAQSIFAATGIVVGIEKV